MEESVEQAHVAILWKENWNFFEEQVKILQKEKFKTSDEIILFFCFVF